MDIKKCPCGRVEFKKGLVAVYITGMDQYEGGGGGSGERNGYYITGVIWDR